MHWLAYACKPWSQNFLHPIHRLLPPHSLAVQHRVCRVERSQILHLRIFFILFGIPFVIAALASLETRGSPRHQGSRPVSLHWPPRPPRGAVFFFGYNSGMNPDDVRIIQIAVKTLRKPAEKSGKAKQA